MSAPSERSSLTQVRCPGVWSNSQNFQNGRIGGKKRVLYELHRFQQRGGEEDLHNDLPHSVELPAKNNVSEIFGERRILAETPAADLHDMLLDPIIIPIHAVSPYVGLLRYELPILQQQ